MSTDMNKAVERFQMIKIVLEFVGWAFLLANVIVALLHENHYATFAWLWAILVKLGI